METVEAAAWKKTTWPDGSVEIRYRDFNPNRRGRLGRLRSPMAGIVVFIAVLSSFAGVRVYGLVGGLSYPALTCALAYLVSILDDCLNDAPMKLRLLPQRLEVGRWRTRSIRYDEIRHLMIQNVVSCDGNGFIDFGQAPPVPLPWEDSEVRYWACVFARVGNSDQFVTGYVPRPLASLLAGEIVRASQRKLRIRR